MYSIPNGCLVHVSFAPGILVMASNHFWLASTTLSAFSTSSWSWAASTSDSAPVHLQHPASPENQTWSPAHEHPTQKWMPSLRNKLNMCLTSRIGWFIVNPWKEDLDLLVILVNNLWKKMDRSLSDSAEKSLEEDLISWWFWWSFHQDWILCFLPVRLHWNQVLDALMDLHAVLGGVQSLHHITQRATMRLSRAHKTCQGDKREIRNKNRYLGFIILSFTAHFQAAPFSHSLVQNILVQNKEYGGCCYGDF